MQQTSIINNAKKIINQYEQNEEPYECAKFANDYISKFNIKKENTIPVNEFIPLLPTFTKNQLFKVNMGVMGTEYHFYFAFVEPNQHKITIFGVFGNNPLYINTMSTTHFLNLIDIINQFNNEALTTLDELDDEKTVNIRDLTYDDVRKLIYDSIKHFPLFDIYRDAIRVLTGVDVFNLITRDENLEIYFQDMDDETDYEINMFEHLELAMKSIESQPFTFTFLHKQIQGGRKQSKRRRLKKHNRTRYKK